MKKTLAMILALVMVLALSVPCFAEKENVGQLVQLNATEEVLNEEFDEYSFVFFDDLASMLLALESGKIGRIVSLPECVINYIAKTNEKFAPQIRKNPCDCKFAMGTLAENTEVFELLNSAIETLKENGTLEKLQKEYVDDLLESGEEPKAVELPVYPGAKTIKVAVTGDLPPVDYVAADGTPAGFNVALLAEISKLAKVNIELVQVNSASRLMALTSGTADAIFCFTNFVPGVEEYVELASTDIPDSVSVTADYYISPLARMTLK